MRQPLKEYKAVCHRDCPDTCFVDVHVERGRIMSTKGSTENPITQGFLCPRGNGDPERVYSESRVLYPHVKTNGKNYGGFKRVRWQKAIELIARKLRQTIAQYGNESVLVLNYPGNQGLLAWQYPERLWSFLGATKHVVRYAAHLAMRESVCTMDLATVCSLKICWTRRS